DFPTLAHVIGFVHDRCPKLAPETPVAAAKAAPEVTPVAVPAAVLVPDQAGDPVQESILDLAVEKTGYPRDMLDLDLDLEADLGVDTVKQAEMFAAIRATYGISRDDKIKLRDFPTLAHVIGFVHERRPDLAPTAVPPTSNAASVPAPDVPAADVPTSSPVPSAAVPVQAVAEQAVAVQAVAGQAASDDAILEKVLEIAAAKTGYPKEMLDLDLDLEADLGIDTVKQAEMFASVRAAFGITRDATLKLRDFPTLAHVIQFAHNGQAALPIAQAPPAPARPAPANFDAADRIPRRVPVAVLRPALSLCKLTGASPGAGSRVILMPDNGGVADALAARLQAMGVEVLRITGTPDADALVSLLNKWKAAGPVQGVYWLPALDHEGSLGDMQPADWHEALRIRLKSLYTTMRALYDRFASPGTFLISATRLGGRHGYDEAGAVAPLGGAVAGFTKTFKRERLEALVKVVDFAVEQAPAEAAQILIEETLRDPGAIEIGYQGGQRWAIGLQEQPVADGQVGMALNQDSVFLITGAAGSIVSAITADLAAASGGTFYLLDMVPEPNPNNADIQRFVNDKDNLKRDLFARMQARGERATPALVEKELAGLERANAALSAIDAVRAAGGTAHYFSVNLTDGEAVAAAVRQVRERSGRIDVLLHAAGIERSHFLPDKDPREFNLVFDVKSDGWFHLLHAIGDMPLAATVAFSSVAGRFGNAGQADYSSANDLLCKITSSFRTTRPGTRGIVIDWTAWGGIGMATRGSIPKMMELAGIDMLPAEAGIPFIRRELTMGAARGEIVVGQRLGVMLNEWDATGGLDMAAVEAQGGHGPMIGRIAGLSLYGGLTIETALDPATQPFLHDHQIDGTPVLPGVMGVEGFAEAALWMLPGWQLEGIEDVNFLAPFKFYRNQPRTLTIQSTFYAQGDEVVADCRLTGSRTLPNQTEPQVTTHFTARVRLAKQPSPAGMAPVPGKPAGEVVVAADIYHVYFHGPAYQVVERAWMDEHRIVGQNAGNLPANHHPAERSTQMAPRLIELCFQTAGLWEISGQGRMGLPQHIDSVRVWRAPDNSDRPDQTDGRLYAVVTPNAEPGSFDAEVVDARGNRYVQLRGYRTVGQPGTVDAGPLRALQAVLV
ncbi:MAG TPA: SDR family NAD(P)-dependent oxidoreductase, partial [Candidatus Acidoferrales bacterium]|nr:SDR family NAD(P)-dependent oxidoreductase [Candidatus Acidoferrales bacterium]